MRETRFRSLGQENSLEKVMATHFSTLAWKIPWTEEPGGLQSMGSHRIWHHRATSQLHSHIFINQNRNHYNQHIFANRNKFVYYFNVKICALGFHGLFESIFCLLLVVEAFSLQKIIKLLEEVVVGWQEVRWIWHIRQVRSTFEVLVVQYEIGHYHGADWACSVEQCRLQALHFSVRLRCNHFTRIQKAVVCQTSRRPPWPFFVTGFALGSNLEPLLSPTTELIISGCCIRPIFCHVTVWSRNGSLLGRVREDNASKRWFFWFAVSS